MATQYTPILKLALPVTGELSGTWGDVVNDNITSMIEQAVAGLATINTWTANSHTLTTANGTTSESRCAMLVAQDGSGGSALTAAGEIICPASSKLYVLKNASSYTITLKTAAGTGVAVVAGNTTFLFCDGTNVNACVTTIVDGRVTGNLTVDGNATVNGNTTLGNATSDTITATARFASGLTPSADNTYDLGSSGNSWKDVYIDGTAYLALVDINGGAIDGVTLGTNSPVTEAQIDNININGNTIASTNTNGNVVIAPNGTGDVQLDADTVRVGDSGAAATLTSNGAGALTVTTGGAANLVLSTNSGTTSGTITINNGANGNIAIVPDGTGDVQLDADTIRVGDSNTDVTITSNGTGNLNLSTNGGTNSGTIQIVQGVNGNITLTPNGTGSVSVPKLVWSNGTSGRVPYLTTGGQFTDDTDMTFDGTTLTVNGLTVSGTSTFSGGTANQVVYLNGSKQATTSANLTFDGTTLTAANFTDSSLTSGRVTYATTGGNLTDSANLLYSGTDLTVYGITVGRGAGAVGTNTAVGASALAANTSGTQNTAFGFEALKVATASNNTAVGTQTLFTNTSGTFNTGVGLNALAFNTTGSSNTALGDRTLFANTTGSESTAVGGLALNSSTTGSFNIAVGNYALYSNTTASNNTAVGYQAGYSNTTGTNNTAIGIGALYSNGTTSGNTSIGAGSLAYTTSGTNNTAVGYNAGNLLTTGAKNTILGCYNGNQGGLDIRTANNYIVLSDGDGNPRAHWDGSGNTFLKGSYVSFGNNGYIRTDETNYLALQAGSAGFVVKNNGNGVALLAMSGSTGSSLALEGASVQSGIGITFPATQNASSNANTLDDYEEGTWTPTVGGNATMGIQAGDYIKIGKLVWINFDFSVVTLGTGSNKFITGLPFTFNGGQSARTAGSVNYFVNLASTASAYYLQIDGNGIYLDLNNAAAANITDGPVWIGNGTRIMGTIMYQTTA